MRRRTTLEELVRLWPRTTAAERRAFLRWVAAGLDAEDGMWYAPDVELPSTEEA